MKCKLLGICVRIDGNNYETEIYAIRKNKNKFLQKQTQMKHTKQR